MRPTRIDLPPDLRQTLTELLQVLVLDGTDLALRAQVAHWNVRGPMFAPLHALFGEVYTAAAGWVDTNAERIVTLGGRVEGHPQAVAARSGLPKLSEGATSARDYLRVVADALGSFIGTLRKTITNITADPVTQNMLQDQCAGAEKLLWMVEATLDEGTAPA